MEAHEVQQIKEKEQLSKACATVLLLIASDPIGHNQWRNWIERGKVKDPEAEKILRQHFEDAQVSQLRHKSGGIGLPLDFEEA